MKNIMNTEKYTYQRKQSDKTELFYLLVYFVDVFFFDRWENVWKRLMNDLWLQWYSKFWVSSISNISVCAMPFFAFASYSQFNNKEIKK